jgi:ATP-dependent Clp protease ATP-binding subunit ClpX
VAIYQHYRRKCLGGVYQGTNLSKGNVLIHGPSGTGKTLLLKTAAKMVDVPIFVADATRFTSAGYVGDDVESILTGLYAAANGDVERASWGIVVVDEIDKIRRFSGRGPAGYKDVSGESVQQALLKMVEGGTVTFPAKGRSLENTVTLDTANILFVFLGSFAGIDEIVTRRLSSTSRLGFGGTPRKIDETVLEKEAPTPEDFIEFGMIPEFMGRIPIRAGTVNLTIPQIRSVLTDPQDSILEQKSKLFEMDGFSLTFTDAALDALAEKAHKDPTGVRSLSRILEDLLAPYYLTLPSEENGGKITFSAEAVTDPVNVKPTIERNGPPS